MQLYVLRLKDDCEPSPFVWRTRLALAHKGLEAERIGIGYGDKARIAFTGQGLVPVLVDGARWVNDSWAIAEYLEDAYPDRPSLFGGAAGQAGTRFVDRWADVEQLGALRLLLWPPTCDATPPADQPYFREDRARRAGGMSIDEMRADPEGKIRRFRRTIEPLRQTLTRQPFLAGTAPAYADHVAAGAFLWARSVARFELVAHDDPVARWLADMFRIYGHIGLP